MNPPNPLPCVSLNVFLFIPVEEHTCTACAFSKLNYDLAQTLIGSFTLEAELQIHFEDSYEQDRVIALQPTAHFSYVKEANKLP